MIKKGSAWQKIKHQVIDQGLCNRCGSCVGLCQNGTIQFVDVLGKCLPQKIKSCSCPACQKISWQACSGKYVPFPKIEKKIFGKTISNRLLGNVLQAFVGYSRNPQIRRLSSSGGLITTTLLHLLENKKIGAAVVAGNNKQKPYKSEVQLAKTKAAIIKAAQSKYTILPVNTILHLLSKFKGKVAYVSLPCQTHSLRKLQLKNHPSVANIDYVLGSYCGINLHFNAVKSFLKNQGVDDLEKVKSLQFRAGEWPGKMRAETTDGQIFELEKFYANYLIPFYSMQRCLLCTDLTNELADISFGDAWAPIYEERKKGWSLVLVRTKKGQKLIENMRRKKIVKLTPISEQKAINMHSHMLDFKKRGAFIRIFRKPPNQRPNYNYLPINLQLKRQLFEYLISFFFYFCQTRLSRFIIEHLPLKISGKLFMKTRLWWKKLTFSTKRSGLTKIKFKLTNN